MNNKSIKNWESYNKINAEPIECFVKRHKRVRTIQYSLMIAIGFGFLLIQVLDRFRVW